MKRPLRSSLEGSDSGLIAEARHDPGPPGLVVLKVWREAEAPLLQQAAALKHLHRGVHAGSGAAEAAGQVGLALGHAVFSDGEDHRPLDEGEANGQAFCSPAHAELSLQQFHAFGRASEIAGPSVHVHHGQT